MKKNFVFQIAFLIALIAFSSNAIAYQTNPQIQLIDYNLTANPASPGQTVQLTLQLENVNNVNCAENTEASIAVSNPLSITGRDSVFLGNICSGDDKNGIVSFQLKVDKLAQTGNYPVLINETYKLDYASFTNSDTIYLNINAEPSFSASIVSSTPEDIYPGDTANISVSFQNKGTGKAQATRFNAISKDGLEIKWAGSSQELGQLNALSTTTANLAIQAPKSLVAGNHNIELTLSFTDDNKNQVNQVFDFVVPVKPKADFEISTTSVPVLLNGDSTMVKLFITNTGQDAAKKAKLRILPSFPFSSDGTIRYIENLEPGQNAELDYQIAIDNSASSGNQLLSVLVDFENSEQTEFNDTVDFSLPVRTKNILDLVLQNALLLIALIIIAAFLFTRRKKKPD